MRTIEECTEEIFRRSKIKIRNKKRKNRIIQCCMPVVFCICSLAIWKALPPGGSTNGDVLGFDGTAEVGSTSTALHYFEVKSDNEHFYITDNQSVSLILNILEDSELVEYSSSPTEEITPPTQSATYGTGTDKLSPATNYLLTYYTTDGNIISYTNNGNLLINNSNGHVQILDELELSQLLKALGIA